MDDAADLTGDLSQYQTNIQVPIIHEQPKTTLDSLNQIRSEFSQKLEEANAKNDNAKKRRYQRQLKQYEDAIKATKEGKTFNYGELVVPPGFSQIPLMRDGRPVVGSNNNSGGRSEPHKSNSSINPVPSAKPTPARVPPPAPAPASNLNSRDEEEASDDLLRYLENEIDDDDLNDIEPDPEEEKYNKLINNASKHIVPFDNKKNPLPKNVDNFDDDDDFLNSELNNQVTSLKIPQPQQAKQISPKIIPVLPSIPRQPQQQQQQQPARNVPGASNSVRRVQNKELTIILERQRLFKEAALKAKQDGNTKVALVYLRHAKGFEQMIIAAENGLPLDMNNVSLLFLIFSAIKILI